jgi:hypothetical protein
VEEKSSKLEEANSEIDKLKLQLDKETMIKKVYIGIQNKSNSILPLPTSLKVS